MTAKFITEDHLPALRGVRADACSLSEIDPEALCRLLHYIHANLLCLTETLLPDLLTPVREVCERSGIALMSLAGENPGSGLQSSSDFRQYNFQVDPFTREAWAAGARRAVGLATDAEGICIVDLSQLICPAGEALLWHVRLCYRPIFPTVDLLRVPAGRSEFGVPIEMDCRPHTAPTLEALWEILDRRNSVARGVGILDVDSGVVRIAVREVMHPDRFSGAPRLSVRFHERPGPPPPAPTGEPSMSEVLVVRRNTAATLQITGAGEEFARFELRLILDLPVKCTIHRDPDSPAWLNGGRLRVALRNQTEKPLRGELRVMRHSPGERPLGVLQTQEDLAPQEIRVVELSVAGDSLSPGENRFLAGFQSDLGVSLGATIIYKAEKGTSYLVLRNDDREPVTFFHRVPGESSPRRFDLDGDEERVEPLPFQTPPPSDLPLQEITLRDPVLEREHAWVTIPISVRQVRWRRLAFWDTYPKNHPDAPDGQLPTPAVLSSVIQATIEGDHPSFLVTEMGHPVDLMVVDQGIRVRCSAGHPGGARIGLLLWTPEDASRRISLSPPHWVRIRVQT